MSSGFTHESTYNESKEWYTPPFIFERLGLEFDLDPCAPVELIIPWIPVKKRYTMIDDGLKQNWGTGGRVWTNPPYGSDTPKWLKKLSEHGRGIALVFARTDTEWFHNYAIKANLVCFIKGRIRFMRPDLTPGGTPGTGSMLLAYGNVCADAVLKSELGQCYINKV